MTSLSLTLVFENFPGEKNEYLNFTSDFSHVEITSDENILTVQATAITKDNIRKTVEYRYEKEHPIPKQPLLILYQGDDRDFVSSMIQAVTYDSHLQEVGICFDLNSNVLYVYRYIPLPVFIDFINADSIGQFYNNRIKRGVNIEQESTEWDEYLLTHGISVDW